MTLKYADRVFETSTTTGTGTINLSGAVTSYQSFIDGVGTGAKVPYCIKDGLNWEVGIGTVTAGTPDTLSRDFIIDSSNSGNAVNWGAGQRDVFLAASNILQFLRDENLNDTNEIAVSSSGTGSAHIATPFVTPIDFSDRMIVRWRAPATNPDGDGITLDWGGLGAKPYVNNDATDFETGVIQAGSIQEAVYNLAQDRFERTSPIYPATPPANMVSYDNTTSGLTANDVQGAISEISGDLVNGVYSDLPSGDFSNLSWPTNGETVTMLHDGYLRGTITGTTNGMLYMNVDRTGITSRVFRNSGAVDTTIPVNSGDVVNIGYLGGGTLGILRNIKANRVT